MVKIFDLIGPKTKRVITIEDDEMLEWKTIKIKDYEGISLEDYIRLRKNESAEAWKDAIIARDNDMIEFYKGQYLVLRALLEPEYR